ncbi:MAG: glutamine synthetase [Clostridiales bacterium]|nr:glutamine synthetase [Clostridiales bacterium]
MTDFHVYPDLLYVIPTDKHSTEDIKQILRDNPAIKFVSLAGVDLSGNDTDEKIPISDFYNNPDKYLEGHAVQTDGSSVVLPGIATLNDGKVDLIPDPDVIWYVDYNYEHIDPATKLPVGTLRIPSFLKHNDDFVCSRSVLKKSADFFEKEIIKLFEKDPALCEELGFTLDDLDSVNLIVATELEFWVNSPDEVITTEQLSISQELKESYWKRTKGVVRTALEQVIMLLELYGFNPEMGHKEVGGVKASINSSGDYHLIMEQLEVDWKYSDALQGADYELIARILIKEIFRLHGLDVSFDAKPLNGVAGSGEHTHVNAVAHLKDGRKINLFSPEDLTTDYLSTIGWGCLMGIMKNYSIINPFVSASTDAFARLTPGFEAPTHAVASIGMDVATPSRNRSVLLGLVRTIGNTYATRFELRAPNPHTNTYLCVAAIYQCMLDGLEFVAEAKLSRKELEAEFCKPYGTPGKYLDKDRLYRCEDDIFEDMDEEERDRLFGKPSYTVYDSMLVLKNDPKVETLLCRGDVFSDLVLKSYAMAMLERWEMELIEKIIPANLSAIRGVSKVYSETVTPYDETLWNKINDIKRELGKDSEDSICIFSQIKKSIADGNFAETSENQIRMNKLMKELAILYKTYNDNQIV